MNDIAISQLSEGLETHIHPIGFSRTMEAVTEKQITSMGLPKDFGSKVCITGQEGDLVMFQFIDTQIPAPDSALDQMSSFEKLGRVRGWVYNIRTSTLLATSMCEDRVIFGPEEKLQNFHNNGFSFFPFVEGTIIRFVYDGSKWISLTQRRINASNTKMPETEIKVLDILTDVCPDFNTDKLDASMVYVFMIVHPQNQIMNPSPVEESVIFLGNMRGFQSVELDENVCALEGITTMSSIGLDIAKSMASEEKWILMIRGTEVYRFGVPQMTNLLRVRYIKRNPHFTTTYLYLATPLQDRKYLPAAVSHTMRRYVTEEFMEEWCKIKAESLAEFMVMCKIAFSGGLNFTLKYGIRNFCKDNRESPAYTGDRVVLDIFYSNLVSETLKRDPLAFYRLTKDMDSFNNSFTKTNLVKEMKPNGPVFLSKDQKFSLPVPDFSSDPTPKESANMNKKKKRGNSSSTKKNPPSIKNSHRRAKKSNNNNNNRCVNLADVLDSMNLDN